MEYDMAMMDRNLAELMWDTWPFAPSGQRIWSEVGPVTRDVWVTWAQVVRSLMKDYGVNPAPPAPSAAAPASGETDREYARRIVGAHQHAHGPREVRATPERCAACRDLIDAITHALSTNRGAAPALGAALVEPPLRQRVHVPSNLPILADQVRRLEARIAELEAEVRRLTEARDTWTKISDAHPPPHAPYEVNRADTGRFVGTPCYGMHLPWWVPLTADLFAPGKVAFPMREDDEWRAVAPPPARGEGEPTGGERSP